MLAMPPELRAIQQEAKALEQKGGEGWECKLFYSGLDTYIPNGKPRPSIFILALNPGGKPGDECDALNAQGGRSFCEHGFSAYLDEKWNKQSAPGKSQPQKRVQEVCNALMDGSGEELLRQVPSGNINPVRTQDAKSLFGDPRKTEEAILLGFKLLALSKPSVILCFGNEVTKQRRGKSTFEILLNKQPDGWPPLETVKCLGPVNRFVHYAHLELWGKDTLVVGLPHFSHYIPPSVYEEVAKRRLDILRHAGVQPA